MKKFLSILLVLTLVLSLGVTAFADETVTENGSITITNATIGNTYKIFKIFDASYSKDNAGNTTGVSYSIEKPTDKTDANTRIIFETLFGADGTAPNPYFKYNADTGEVSGIGTISKENLSEYLNDLVEKLTPTRDPIKATSSEVKFEGLEYGYYVIDKEGTNDPTVTITNVTPTVEVIDKNQKPGTVFNKLVWDEDYDGPDQDIRVDKDNNTHTGKWVVNSSANIGDKVDFKVEFEATNYNGEDQVKHYTVVDTKGDALWVEFNSVKVTVDGIELDRGYYHGLEGTYKTGEWEFFGTWTDEQKAKERADHNQAQWYMIHRGYDAFDIVIPWMDNHKFTGKNDGYSLEYGENAKSINPSPVTVTVEYMASVEPNAKQDGSNLFNKASLFWTDETVSKHPDEPQTGMTIHALGVTKTDGETGDPLAGAVFGLYSDEACTKPVYVIPTDVKGVYILDDLDTIVSGEHRETSRKKYEDQLDDYLKGERQKNVVETLSTGRLAILGLEKGEYWLKEIDAPNGYNKLAAAIHVVIDGTTTEYAFTKEVKDGEGNVTTKTEFYVVKHVPVTNNKGVELPSTGGEGTMMLITIGTLMAIGFAVFLITHKKMSTYTD